MLTDDTLGQLSTSVNMLLRVAAVVDWSRLRYHGRDPWLRFYEDFLEVYDPELRKRTGSYYTPNEVVASMVRMVDDLLRRRLGQAEGFASSNVVAADPAMGTGTFLLHIIELIAERVENDEGAGAVAPRLRDSIGRVIGFERQLGPYAVAELRAFEEYQRRQVELPPEGLRFYVTDTLGNPYVEETHLAAALEPIARSRRAANKVKREEPVMVVIGNPPYKDYAKNLGGWIEGGDVGTGRVPLLSDFMPPRQWKVSGTVMRHLYNLYVYFWRWALWKVFEAHPEVPHGVVAFITSAGFLTGDGFAAMRQHIRRVADEVWIIDLTPEGHQPDVNTRVFPKVQQRLCIAVVLRDGTTDEGTPATVHYQAVTGRRADKFAALGALRIDDDGWQACETGWMDRFTPAATGAWHTFPALVDLLPWSSPGVGANRSWPIGTSEKILSDRWRRLVETQKPPEKANLLKETADRNLGKTVAPLPGVQPHATSIGDETNASVTPEPYGWRSFHRAWIIPDARVLDRPRPELWRVRSARQIFAAEQHSEALENGPAVTFTALVPDLHFFNGRGGRVFPLYRDAATTALNVAPGLLSYLGDLGLRPIGGDDLLAYIAALVAHSGFTTRFQDNLATPGVRIPISGNPALWTEAVDIGREVLWLHTFGERLTDRAHGRPRSRPRLPESERPKVVTAIPDTESSMPEDFEYDPTTQTLRVGTGRIAPVPEPVWVYEVSSYRVVQRWLRRRMRKPEGKRSSPLDDLVEERWTPRMTTELLELLNVVGRTIALEKRQAELLDRVLAGPLVTVEDLVNVRVLPVLESSRRSLKRDNASSGLFD